MYLDTLVSSFEKGYAWMLFLTISIRFFYVYFVNHNRYGLCTKLLQIDDILSRKIQK